MTTTPPRARRRPPPPPARARGPRGKGSSRATRQVGGTADPRGGHARRAPSPVTRRATAASRIAAPPRRRQTTARRPPANPRRPATRTITRRHRGANCRGRLAATRVAMLVAFLVLAARLVQVQALESDRYSAFGETQRVRSAALPAERGAIFDRDGRDLALTVHQSTVVADPRLVTDPLGTANALSPLLGVDTAVLQDRLTRDLGFVYLARKVDDGVANQVKAMKLAGVSLIEEPERFLPAGELALPILGRVGTDNNGLSGLETQYEDQLAGKPGKVTVERDPRGGEIPGSVKQFDPSTRGDDLVLTLDRSLQYETERALSDEIVKSHSKAGTAIVMQTTTGEVLALANLQAGQNGAPPAQATKNLAVTNVFEPGSVNKVITIAAALEEGIVHPADVLTVPGTLKVADHVFSEHDPHPPVRWSITDIMANSSNVGSIMIGKEVGKTRIDSYLRDFGFGAKTGLGFPGESRGILLDPKKWSGTSIGTVPIGQGLAVTAMQMVGAYNAIANGGTWVEPKLVRATVDKEGQRHSTAPAERRSVVSARTAQQVTAMLTEVVRVGTGTQAAVAGYNVAGKTGTARKPMEGHRGYQAGAYVSSFAGFVPAEKPEFTIIVVLDEPTPIYGGLVAAPVFSEIARYALRQYQVPPPPDTPRPAAAEVPKTTTATAGEAGRDGGVIPVAPTTTTTLPQSPPPSSPSP